MADLMTDLRIGESVLMQSSVGGPFQEVIISGKLIPRRAKGWDKMYNSYEAVNLSGAKFYAMPHGLVHLPPGYDSRQKSWWADLAGIWQPKGLRT